MSALRLLLPALALAGFVLGPMLAQAASVAVKPQVSAPIQKAGYICGPGRHYAPALGRCVPN
jgi:hypothetical protein